MNKKITNSILAVTLFLLSACSGFLDIKPYGKTIPKTADEFEALLHNRLNDIDYANSGLLVNTFMDVYDLEAYADNLDASLTDFSSANMPLYIGSSLLSMSTKYAQLYEIIRDCNITIDELGEGGTDLDKKVLGTAYALRGVSYYKLMIQFCEPVSKNPSSQLGVPLVYTFDMEERATSKKRYLIKSRMKYIGLRKMWSGHIWPSSISGQVTGGMPSPLRNLYWRNIHCCRERRTQI